MKKSKIINLILLTVSFAASAKIEDKTNGAFVDPETVSNASGNPMSGKIANIIASYGSPASDAASLESIIKQEIQNAAVTRGGFGDNEKHSGAEQSRNTDEKK